MGNGKVIQGKKHSQKFVKFGKFIKFIKLKKELWNAENTD
jgi:hypothetical protein